MEAPGLIEMIQRSPLAAAGLLCLFASCVLLALYLAERREECRKGRLRVDQARMVGVALRAAQIPLGPPALSQLDGLDLLELAALYDGYGQRPLGPGGLDLDAAKELAYPESSRRNRLTFGERVC